MLGAPAAQLRSPLPTGRVLSQTVRRGFARETPLPATAPEPDLETRVKPSIVNFMPPSGATA